jgi:hypothetical protein
MNIEPLESRVAPATLVNPTTVTYTDIDGDLVTVKVSKGALTEADFTFNNAFNTAGAQVLQLLDLHNSGPLSKANVSITAKRTAAGGDGRVNVGFIDASGTDLGTVIVAGDLGRIEAGDPNTSTTGLRKLSVTSMGRFGITTQAPGGNLQTSVNGPLGTLIVSGDLDEAAIDVFATGLVNGRLGKAVIGGSVIGGASTDSGSIEASGGIGSIFIGGDLRGGSGNLSGQLHAIGKMGNVTVGGSVIGGNGPGTRTGHLLGEGGIGKVKIGGDLRAGSGLDSGSINSGGNLGGLNLGGSLIGGDAADPTGFAQVSSDAGIGPVVIGGDLRGGAGFGSAAIKATGKIASLKVGGSFIGGTGISGASVSALGYGAVTIGGSLLGGGGVETARLIARVDSDIASLTIGGSIIGGTGSGSGTAGSLQGTLGPTKIGGDVIGGGSFNTGQIFGGNEKMPSLTIGGSLIGSNFNSTGIISAFTAGRIKIGGDLVGGSISGSEDTERTGFIQAIRIGSIFIGGSIIAGTDTSSGDADLNASIRATVSIGSITVKGSILGNSSVRPLISANGKLGSSGANVIAIKSLSVAGRVEFADILGGYNTNGNGDPANPDAQIGTVTIGGDWIASNLVAGVIADNAFFGDGDDDPITEPGEPDALISKITRIVIKGQVIGTGAIGDHFGFVAQQIGSFKVGGTALPLTSGVGNDTAGLIVASTDDVRVREVTAL